MAALSPLLAAIAAAIRLDSPGPVLYRATRSGRGGLPFTMFKFRTMQERRETHGPKITTHADRRDHARRAPAAAVPPGRAAAALERATRRDEPGRATARRIRITSSCTTPTDRAVLAARPGDHQPGRAALPRRGAAAGRRGLGARLRGAGDAGQAGDRPGVRRAAVAVARPEDPGGDGAGARSGWTGSSTWSARSPHSCRHEPLERPGRASLAGVKALPWRLLGKADARTADAARASQLRRLPSDMPERIGRRVRPSGAVRRLVGCDGRRASSPSSRCWRRSARWSCCWPRIRWSGRPRSIGAAAVRCPPR